MIKFKKKDITSLDNSIVKHVYKLKLKKYRNIYKQVLVEGIRVIDTVLNSNWSLEYIFYSDKAKKAIESLKDKIDSNKIIYVNDIIINKLTNLTQSPGIIAVFNFKEIDLDIVKLKKALILDNIQDPGNMATIIRSAMAFGFNNILTIGSVDIYNPKVIQASAGLVSLANIVKIDISYIINLAKLNNIKLISLVLKDGISLDSLEFNDENIFLIAGNEANGIDLNIRMSSHILGTIFMDDNVESLNVAVATSIAMYIINLKLNIESYNNIYYRNSFE
jgi:TrmH family RNA methyltransferase